LFITLLDREVKYPNVIQSLEFSKHVHVTFDVTVYLPRPSGVSLLQVKNFETDMPLFAHYVGDLGKTVNFGHVSLKTANVSSQIEVSNDIYFNDPSVLIECFLQLVQTKTRNSPFERHFYIFSSLILVTSNAVSKSTSI